MSRDRLLDTFLELVRIDSPPGSELACALRCEELLRDAGCQVRYDDTSASTGSDTGNMIATLPGTAPGMMALSAHLDTVEPCRGIEPIVRDGVVFSAGPTILGADDRSGLAVAIECVRRLVEEGGPRPDIKLVFTVQEEVGLVGAKALSAEDASADLCLVLDADGPPGGIIIGAPTHYTFTARFTGLASHAGVAPEKGISAIRIASDAVMRMDLGRLDAETTANIGSIKGGAATNVVPASVDMTGECRSLDGDSVERVRESMHRAMVDAAADAGGSVEVIWKLEYGGFRIAEDDARVGLVRHACADVGLEARTFCTGGGSDANVFAALGVPTLALSCGMEGVHGTSEQIKVADLEALASLTIAIARRMATE